MVLQRQPPNPFKPEAGSPPALLAGREKETKQLTEILKRLQDPCVSNKGEPFWLPLSPARIIGPRGVGKTALLNWVEEQAEKRGIRCVACGPQAKGEPPVSLTSLIDEIASGSTKKAAKSISSETGSENKKENRLPRGSFYYQNVLKTELWKRPLLLLLDEAERFNLPMLETVMKCGQRLISEGRSLGMVLAGTPALDNNLAKVDAGAHGERILINALSDQATREALRRPFRSKRAAVTDGALKTMVAQTDNHPYFTQLVGREIWSVMRKAGRKDVNLEMVRQAEGKVRAGQEKIYDAAYARIEARGLLPQACRVIEMLESRDGQANEGAVFETLATMGSSFDEEKAEDDLASLQEDGFIRTADYRVKPGIPSFFSYFKARCEGQAATGPAGAPRSKRGKPKA